MTKVCTTPWDWVLGARRIVEVQKASICGFLVDSLMVFSIQSPQSLNHKTQGMMSLWKAGTLGKGSVILSAALWCTWHLAPTFPSLPLCTLVSKPKRRGQGFLSANSEGCSKSGVAGACLENLPYWSSDLPRLSLREVPFFWKFLLCSCFLHSFPSRSLVPRNNKRGLLQRLEPLGPPYIQIDLSALNWNALVSSIPNCEEGQNGYQSTIWCSMQYATKSFSKRHTVTKGWRTRMLFKSIMLHFLLVVLMPFE